MLDLVVSDSVFLHSVQIDLIFVNLNLLLYKKLNTD